MGEAPDLREQEDCPSSEACDQSCDQHEKGVIQSVHMCGFYDDHGTPRLPDSASPSSLSPYEHYRLIERNVTHFGAQVAERKVTRTLDGWLVGVEFIVPAHGGAATMWHRIAQPRAVWADPDFPPGGSDA